MKKIWIALAATTAFACSGDGSIDSEDNGLIEVLEIEVHGDSWTQLARRQIARPAALKNGSDVVGSARALSYICTRDAMSLWDQASFLGNRLCVSGTGSVDLTTVPRGSSGGNWRNRIRSYQTHSEFGFFIRNGVDLGTTPPAESITFCANTSDATPPVSIQEADALNLSSLRPGGCF